MLTATTDLPDGKGHLFSGRVSRHTPTWAPQHIVHGSVILPGTSFIDMILDAVRSLGCDRIDELTHHVFLAVPQGERLQIHLTIGEPDSTGCRTFALHTRPEDTPSDAEWTLHATGTASVFESAPTTSFDATLWPPSGTPLDITEFYERIVDAGFDYGPLFRGLRAAWQDGTTTYAEIALPDGTDPTGYGIHPGLLDSALQPAALVMGNSPKNDSIRVPFSWRDVTVHAIGTTHARIRLSRPTAETVSLDVADRQGAPVVTIGSLAMRPVSAEQLQAAIPATADGLYHIEWTQAPSVAGNAGGLRPAVLGDSKLAVELSVNGSDVASFPNLAALRAAVATGNPTPDILIVPVDAYTDAMRNADDQLPHLTHDLCKEVLGLVQELVATDGLAVRVAFLTSGAIATTDDEDISSLGSTAIWGLIRTAQTEEPGRFTLIDSDHAPSSGQALLSALSLSEPQLALRNGAIVVPRLVRTRTTAEPTALDLPADGTVLITGATGGLGAHVARHLACHYGVRHLLLTSRRGIDSPQAAELTEELQERGVQVHTAICDLSDRASVAEVIASVSPDHPLTAVIHCAGVIDDGTIAGLTPQRVSSVLLPKVDAAWHLHDLTRHLDLKAFVLFSSVVGVLGSPGQGNYAAANSYLDGLAQHRTRRGLAATSVSWGLWNTSGGMSSTLTDADKERFARSGIVPMSPDFALTLFDRVIAANRAHVLATRLNSVTLDARAEEDSLPPLFNRLTRSRRRAYNAETREEELEIRRQLSSRSEQEQKRTVLEYLLPHIAGVLGHDTASAIDPASSFKDLGFESLSAVELRNTINKATGLQLPATLLFDYPTPLALADQVWAQIAGDQRTTAPLQPARKTGATRVAEPIAVVGMGCRLPGGVTSPAQLWDLVAGEVDA
ncbi:SDR family NAD(P)-dependent oxidoreductase, partial [Nocardia sp. NPDC004654]|uniref:type I polyketide synthase n=1 Tax=Nocardia sp. NPDC004654 TaxID=3154776 RepID=UPI0033B42AAE